MHGTLADYRLTRLIKYSFYKNITFAMVFFFYQFYNGVSGQARMPLGNSMLSAPAVPHRLCPAAD